MYFRGEYIIIVCVCLVIFGVIVAGAGLCCIVATVLIMLLITRCRCVHVFSLYLFRCYIYQLLKLLTMSTMLNGTFFLTEIRSDREYLKRTGTARHI